MGFSTGTIDSDTSIGTKAYTGFGGQPQAIIFYGGNNTAVNTDTTPAIVWHGASDGTRHACMTAAVDGAASNGDFSTTECINVVDDGGTDVCVATLDSFNADGITLDFSVVPGTAIKINYIAFWGLDNVFVDAYTFGTGSSDIRTAPGFTPNFAFVFARKATRAGYSVGVSQGAGAGDEFGMGFRWRASNPNRYTSYNSESRLAVMADDTSTPEMEFSLTTFDANGYTINKDVGGTSDADFIVISLKGGDWDVGHWDSPTSGAPVDEVVSGLSFAPEGYGLCYADIAGSPTGNVDDAPAGYGSSDGTNEAALWHDVDGQSDEDHGISDTKVIQLRTDAAALVEDADHKTLDAGGFTVTYTTVEAAANEVMWWAFKGAAVGGATGKSNPLYGPLGGPLAGVIG